MRMDTATMHTTSIAMTFRGMARSRIAIRINTNRSRTATRISQIFITGIGIDLVTMGYCCHLKVSGEPGLAQAAAMAEKRKFRSFI